MVHGFTTLVEFPWSPGATGGMITDLCSFTSGEELYVFWHISRWVRKLSKLGDIKNAGCLAFFLVQSQVIQPLPEWQTFGQARKAFDRAVCIGVEDGSHAGGAKLWRGWSQQKFDLPRGLTYALDICIRFS